MFRYKLSHIWTFLYQFVELNEVVLLFKFGCLTSIVCRENGATKSAKRSSNEAQGSLEAIDSWNCEIKANSDFFKVF